MVITYSDAKEIEINQLQSLFASVQWDSANYPEKLFLAIKNSHKVITAWEGNKLVGLMNALSDGIMTAYFHYLLVRPEYHKMNIGRTLVKMMLEDYSEYARKVLIAYEQETEFYKQCGFEVGEGKVPMFVTYLRT
jgi:N-acetylglutamate synthase-like GNAT family acetyltransferase